MGLGLGAGAAVSLMVLMLGLGRTGPRQADAQAAYMQSGPVSLDPTVMVLGIFDWQPYQAEPPFTSRCTDSVNRAAKFGNTRINFVPTHYWVDSRSDGTVDSYCYMNPAADRCLTFTQEAVDSFRIGMELCFRRAVELGMDIALVPHLDDGGKSAAWRNGLVFSPTEKKNGFSYMDVMINPMADALAATIKPTTKIWLAMQGEMSATIMRFPMAYHDAIEPIYQRITQGVKPRPPRANIKIGVSFNFNKLDTANGDGVTPGSATRRGSSSFISALFAGGGRGRRKLAGDQVLGPRVAGIDYPSLMVLLNAVDFIGISSYAALEPDFNTNELQNAAFQFFQEFAAVGVDLASLISARGIEFHYSEYGLGGGVSINGNRPARTEGEAAHTPFYGVWGSYSSRTDPWRTPKVREYLRTFYQRTLEWLGRGGGPTYPVHACFLWGMGSWDVLAINPESTTSEGTYYDPVVASMITAHNARVAGAQLSKPGGRASASPVLVQAAEAATANSNKKK